MTPTILSSVHHRNNTLPAVDCSLSDLFYCLFRCDENHSGVHIFGNPRFLETMMLSFFHCIAMQDAENGGVSNDRQGTDLITAQEFGCLFNGLIRSNCNNGPAHDFGCRAFWPDSFAQESDQFISRLVHCHILYVGTGCGRVPSPAEFRGNFSGIDFVHTASSDQVNTIIHSDHSKYCRRNFPYLLICGPESPDLRHNPRLPLWL